MAENLIERYLTDIREIHATRANAPETSFYPALERLLSDIGRTLSPKVRCVINLANRGAGLPDGGLFTADQFRAKSPASAASANPFDVQTPSRGVIEAKPPSHDVARVAESDQVERYWKRYGMVLVTTFRDFLIIGKDADGRPRPLESFSLAASEAEFWQLAEHPRKAAAEHGERLLEYLRRALLHNAPLAEPRDVAAILASYARDARLRIESGEIPALGGIRQTLEEALGLRFEGEKGEHFFRSTLVQTLFYGVFSAWVLWARRRDRHLTPTSYGQSLRESSPYMVAGAFDWRSAHWLLRVPMLRALFVQVADPARLGALGLIEVLDWAANALNRVDHAQFFESFDAGHAVQYFYEPFLHAFDPELRKALGVWYTPEEIVRYQVERVDTVLRSELGLTDGLADPKVVVLDPCCGTGAYLRAVLRHIRATLHDKGGDALVAHDLKRAAMERLFGFEILPAPFVIAHLQLGLELETLGAPLSDAADPPERVGVYLTNALTGWEPPTTPKTRLLFAEMEEERDAANHVKLGDRILVVLGNPPYNGYAGVAVDEERGLSGAYRTTRRVTAPQGQGLNDLYVRFFRMAERRIIEMNQPGQGVICFISNYSWLDGLSFTGMRERFVDSFSRIWIDCLNGDKYKSGKLTPSGEPDPSVFSTELNAEGIQVGTAVTLLVRRQQHEAARCHQVSPPLGQDQAGATARRPWPVRPADAPARYGSIVHARSGRNRVLRVATVAGAVPGVVPGCKDQPRRSGG
ncbi:MAG TPA: N-6 DNA methylase [Longimicrobiales bacterium]|nr:N-6 DNA methylase [Longimicrobiales bacterium]